MANGAKPGVGRVRLFTAFAVIGFTILAALPLPGRASESPEIATFMFGLSRTLGDSVELNAVPGAVHCMKKVTRKIVFCLENINWPEDVAPILQVRDTAHFKGTQAVALYQPTNGGSTELPDFVATRYFQPFEPQYFDGMAYYLTEMLGPPSNDWARVLRRPGEGELQNRVVRWQIIHGEAEARTIFEAKRYDPNVLSVHGSPMASLHLYKEGAKTIFPGIRTSDLVILSARFMRARARIKAAGRLKDQ